MIGCTEQPREVESTEACPIVEDETYILELERGVQSTKAIVTCLPNMRAPQSCQLQVERDVSSDIPQGESITDEGGSVTTQIVAEFERQEHHSDTELDSPIEQKTD